jgi:hypothetical protein
MHAWHMRRRMHACHMSREVLCYQCSALLRIPSREGGSIASGGLGYCGLSCLFASVCMCVSICVSFVCTCVSAHPSVGAIVYII